MKVIWIPDHLYVFEGLLLAASSWLRMWRLSQKTDVDQQTCDWPENIYMTRGENLPAEYVSSLAPATHHWLQGMTRKNTHRQ